MRPVNRFCTALLLVSSAALAHADSQNVRIPDPVLRFVPYGSIAEACGTPNRVDACTLLDSLRLTCDCEPAEGGWSTHSEFSAVARVVLTDSGYLTHEMGHVQDFRRLIRDYLTEVDAAHYGDLGTCRSAAISVKISFAKKLDEVRRISAFRRDHSPLAGSMRVHYEPGSVAVVSNESDDTVRGGGLPTVATIVSDDLLEPYLEPHIMP